jgi:hypothetical protein
MNAMSIPTSSSLDTITPFSAPTKGKLDTENWFNPTHVTTIQSPVDEFRSNLAQINVLYLGADARGDYMPMLGSLVYLGMVSAAEGYFRSLLRRLILVDEACRHNASSRTLTYGAALHHTEDLLPEALLEGISLANTKNVATELKTLCNISQMSKEGNVPVALERLFKNFESICQVRHCGIHRFGKLGSQQALRLGMDKHKPLLEKPLALTVQQLQEIAEALEALIRAVNSYCFADILKRTYSAGPTGKDKAKLYQKNWQLDWIQDQMRFTEYYDIFASVGGSQPSDSVENMYAAFINFVTTYNKKK